MKTLEQTANRNPSHYLASSNLQCLAWLAPLTLRICVCLLKYLKTTFAPENAGDNTLVSVSSRFNPGELDIMDADVVLFTTDNVFFYVHSAKILRESKDRFGGLVPENMGAQTALGELNVDLASGIPPTLLPVPYLSDVLNIVLHLVYGFSFQTYQPSLQVLHAVIPALQELGYAPHAFLTPNSEMFNLMVQAAAVDPLSTYALAAQYALEPLAVAVSALTLSGSLCGVDDNLARQMGPKYLKRLFCMSCFLTPLLSSL